jgi:hypothetical protein
MQGIDLDYVLRQTRRYGRRRASVRACLLLGLSQQAVDEALAVDLNLAKVSLLLFLCKLLKLSNVCDMYCVSGNRWLCYSTR